MSKKLVSIYRKVDDSWDYGFNSPVSFEILYDSDSEYECKRILEGKTSKPDETFKGSVSITLEDSVITLSVRYFYFKEFIEAFYNNAIVIKYHKYDVIVDFENIKFSDHQKSNVDEVFNTIKAPVTFSFQHR